MNRDELLANHRRQLLDQLIVKAIEDAERAGDERAAGSLRLDRLAAALAGWRYADDTTAEQWRTEARERRRRALCNEQENPT